MAPPQKICIVAPGLSIHAKRWADGLHDRGHEVLWVATGGCDARDTRARQFIPSARRGASEGRILGRMKSSVDIYRAIRRFAPDLVHLHYLLGDRWTHLLSRSWRPFVVSVWGSDVALQEAGRSSARVDRRKQDILARASRVTATSRYLAEQTRRRFDHRDLPIEVIPFGVDLERFSLRPQLSAGQEPVIGFLKTYSAGYGPHVLLEAMSVLCRRLPNIKLLMHGFGDPEPYRAQALELGLADRVRIEGGLPHEEVSAALQQIDVFCMPSLAESFGVAAVEAAACGLAVVASRTGGIPEVVQDGVTGILVEPGDPLALGNALCDLVNDPDRMRTMGEAGRAMVEKSFDWSHNLSQMEAVYEEVLSNSKHPG